MKFSMLRAAEVRPATESLESVLDELSKYGRPALSMLQGNGWWCRVEMNTSATGAEFKVGSECRHVSPIAAAVECRDRVLAAVRGMRT